VPEDYQITDDIFGSPFIDTDEWRDEPRPHRYVHGGFDGSQTRFSFYFPPKELYRGRFAQFLEGGAGGSEHTLTTSFAMAPIEGLAGGSWQFDMAFDDLGAYLVESNQGHFRFEGGLGMEDSLRLYRASAESARFSRHVAAEMYGEAPHHGYVGGGSGGGIRTTACIENAPDVWDGAVPFVYTYNHSLAWPVQGLAMLVLDDKLPAIIDASEPGGSGDPFDGLTNLERIVLGDLYRVGWPRGAENQLTKLGHWAFMMTSLEHEDPEYFDDFWTEPGYEGTDTAALLAPYLVDTTATVRRVVPAGEAMGGLAMFMEVDPDLAYGVILDCDESSERLYMANLRMVDGKAAGRDLLVNGIVGDALTAFGERTPELYEGVEVGDRVQIDNRAYLAFCHYYRHAVRPVAEFAERTGRPATQTGKLFTVNGTPTFPQRVPARTIDQLADLPGGMGFKGRFEGKVILIGATHDVFIWPTQLVDYPQLVEGAQGDARRDNFRVWWVENATHGPAMMPSIFCDEKDPAVWMTRLVDYDPVVRQAFNDVVAWVEEGRAPLDDMPYSFDQDNALVLGATAAERGGYQPVARLTVDGAVCAEVAVGATVHFEGVGEVPPGAGEIVMVALDFEGTGAWAHRPALEGNSAKVRVSATHAFDAPGTYFPSFRVASHPDGTRAELSKSIPNIARARVIVS
jgi:hypothetical protein